MEQKMSNKPMTVSRLPKFSARLANGKPSSLPNPAVQTLENKSISSKPRVVQASSFAVKWRTENGISAAPTGQAASIIRGEKRDSVGTREIKKDSSSGLKVRKAVSPLLTGSRKPASRSYKAASSPNSKVQISPSSTACSSLSTSSTSQSAKFTQNGFSSPCRLRAASNCGSNLLSSSPKINRMVRSQSFTHFRQLPSQLNTPITRSFSFTKSMELAKPLANTRLCPLQAPGLCAPQCLTSSRLGLGIRRLSTAKSHTDSSSDVKLYSCCSIPPNGLKNSLIPTAVSKPSVPGSKLACSFTAKPQCPPVAGEKLIENQIICSHLNTEPFDPDTEKHEKLTVPADLLEGSTAGQEVGISMMLRAEDTPPSSCSSLEENSTTEGVFDDFNLLDMELNISSSELSPSNSSGGTYMWDEEMLEPLRDDTHGSHCGHYGSVLSSTNTTDVVNLASAEAADLKENDLRDRVETDQHKDGCEHRDELSVGGSWNWRENQQQWNDVNDNRTQCPGQSLSHMMDTLSLSHIELDFSSVRSQLLQLRILLQVEDIEMNQDRQESLALDSATQQVEELMREVTSLKEELKMKDRIIVQLKDKQQEQGRCCCQSIVYRDKSTQISWRPSLHHHTLGVSPSPFSHCSCPSEASHPATTLQSQHTSNTTYHLVAHQVQQPVKLSPHRGPQ